MFVAHLLKYGTKRRYHVWVQAVIIQVTETEGLHSRQLLALLFSCSQVWGWILKLRVSWVGSSQLFTFWNDGLLCGTRYSPMMCLAWQVCILGHCCARAKAGLAGSQGYKVTMGFDLQPNSLAARLAGLWQPFN
eukprot:133467-Pelagomonas_calceolata.AAC.2